MPVDRRVAGLGRPAGPGSHQRGLPGTGRASHRRWQGVRVGLSELTRRAAIRGAVGDAPESLRPRVTRSRSGDGCWWWPGRGPIRRGGRRRFGGGVRGGGRGSQRVPGRRDRHDRPPLPGVSGACRITCSPDAGRGVGPCRTFSEPGEFHRVESKPSAWGRDGPIRTVGSLGWFGRCRSSPTNRISSGVRPGNEPNPIARVTLDSELDAGDVPSEPGRPAMSPRPFRPGECLIVGSSMPVRDLDWFADPARR